MDGLHQARQLVLFVILSCCGAGCGSQDVRAEIDGERVTIKTAVAIASSTSETVRIFLSTQRHGCEVFRTTPQRAEHVEGERAITLQLIPVVIDEIEGHPLAKDSPHLSIIGASPGVWRFGDVSWDRKETFSGGHAYSLNTVRSPQMPARPKPLNVPSELTSGKDARLHVDYSDADLFGSTLKVVGTLDVKGCGREPVVAPAPLPFVVKVERRVLPIRGAVVQRIPDGSGTMEARLSSLPQECSTRERMSPWGDVTVQLIPGNPVNWQLLGDLIGTASGGRSTSLKVTIDPTGAPPGEVFLEVHADEQTYALSIHGRALVKRCPDP